MDCGLKTLLLDSFRKPDVPREVRLDAALGHVAPRGQEQLALLALLVDDSDDAVREAAEQTLAAIPPAPLAAVLARSDTPAELVRFFAGRGIAPVPGPETSAVEDEAPLLQASGDAWDTIAEEPGSEASAEPGQSITQQIQQMNIVERVRAAMKGSREVRALLIRDPNKMVSSAVLSSPKLTSAEVESFAKMANVAEDVLRAIGQNRAWVKNYGVAASLTRNPKTPVAMSMNLMQRLIDRDVRALSIDRNVPEALRLAARKRLVKSSNG
ncbi:MAG: hypothetical protein IT181_01240 [Acidobacteria bacterium]|nr:hypothetical protein [Acidobacteriota bacterium]